MDQQSVDDEEVPARNVSEGEGSLQVSAPASPPPLTEDALSRALLRQHGLADELEVCLSHLLSLQEAAASGARKDQKDLEADVLLEVVNSAVNEFRSLPLELRNWSGTAPKARPAHARGRGRFFLGWPNGARCKGALS